MDIHLSGKMDGDDAAKEIISFKDIPIIFCIGYGKKELMERVKKKLKPLACLRKPVIVEEVNATINSYFFVKKRSLCH